jgi:predicted nuclease of restriction endonuclease-like (RecB) superfamily
MTDQANTDSNFNALVASIANTSHHFQQQAQKQVNVTLTLRNWCIGAYLVEYEQHGQDRAQYGDKLLSKLAVNLRQQHIKGLGQTNLKLFRQFYMTYPHIGQTVSDQLPTNVQNGIGLLQSSTSPTPPNTLQTLSGELLTDAQTLINRLSFSHFIELLKADSPLKRAFYEVHTLQNNWSVRELQRAMNSMLYERTGLSTDKTAVLEKHAAGTGMTAQDVFRNPYMLEFLGLDEKTEYSESDLEQAIIDHLQIFLLEMGKGFCFEARQKRITFDNTHYRIDLVFYHRILKCHVLVDLKLGEFDHADAGQMNVYLNYYADQEMSDGDNPPVGIILCASQNAQLVKYATAGMAQTLFVSKYLINLPSEDQLKQIIQDEQEKYRS